jgi:hypothetical protein
MLSRFFMRALLPVVLMGLFLGLSPFIGCDEDGSSPTGPSGGGDASATIVGYHLNPDMSNVVMRISSAEYDSSVSVTLRSYYHHDKDPPHYEYQLTGIPQGTYTIAPDVSAWSEVFQDKYVVLPANRTVVIGSGINRVDPFFPFSREDSTRYTDEGLCCIGGLIYYETVFADTTGSREAAMLRFLSQDGTVMDSLTTYYGWFRTENDLPQGTYTIIPEHRDYTFDPPSRTVHAEDITAVANFNAVYSGDKPYTVSGRVELPHKRTSYQVRIYQYHEGIRGKRSITVMSIPNQATDGSFTSRPLLPGTYWLEIERYSATKWYTQPITITDHDIDLGDIMIEYDGPLYYQVTGSAVDVSGAGIQDVKVSMEGRPVDIPTVITWPMMTDADGTYRFGSGVYFYTREDMSLTITPEKAGWVFSPSSAVVTHAYVEYDEYVELVVPDFIGTPLEIASSFPLDNGASWTYTRSVDGVVYDPQTVDAGTSFDAGGQSYIPLTGSMFRDWKGFRIENAILYAWNGTDVVTYASFDETSWDMGKVDAYSTSGMRLSPEDVTVPAGTFTGCEVIEITVVYGETSSETTTLWLAEDVGPVKIEFTTISKGTMIGRITDELVSYSLP